MFGHSATSRAVCSWRRSSQSVRRPGAFDVHHSRVPYILLHARTQDLPVPHSAANSEPFGSIRTSSSPSTIPVSEGSREKYRTASAAPVQREAVIAVQTAMTEQVP